MVELMAKHHIYLMNDSSNPPTYYSTLGQSWIDLVMLNENVDPRKFNNFHISDNIHLSDHRLITYDILFKRNTYQHTGRMDLNKVNKWKFVMNMNKFMTAYGDLKDNDINDTAIMMNNGIKMVVNSAISKNTKNVKNAPWSNNHLYIERKKVRALRRRYQSEHDDDLRNELKIKYKKSRANYKIMIINTKRNSFRNFLDNITKSQAFGSSYKIIKDKYKSNNLNNNIRKDNDDYTRNYKEDKELIITKYFYNDNILDDCPDIIHNYNNIYERDLNIIELEAALHSIKSNKPVAHDGITIDIIKYLFKAYPDYIYKL